ncbi:NADPH-dependent 7-cyano-7-deazaguanine reductase QueF [Chitinibacter bivalviorum]|uniref:NADPH-dependent 7-cyano-7-deazaguanine reductase n=1 Tax=Chitinibacter bivalviorum TaxID=2739434 RepID=A0A7H9BHZ6_9NEIS|nr:NADPH-dependent 7-cyano-7-deazaguanine reductase QueF [Chitinibacter bivalviorum]QLG87571.1 NADPH-dependent 7-cyano-7-deazaguanine reductase QueF [Chitinibacter bivalviorum]
MSDVAASPLGKTVSYITEYDPSLLFPIPRQVKREEIGIDGVLPFMGLDIWNAYEVSWLNARGKPQIALVTFQIPADSDNIIESKSFKLYLNSFNQTKLDSVEQLTDILRRDIGHAVNASVQVKVNLPDQFEQLRFGELKGFCIDNLDIEVDEYSPQPQLLHCDESDGTTTETLTSNLLKSNCLVTGQPDWASVQIQYVGKPINRESLLRYLISFRNHNEFHEQCVERIFVDLMRACQPMKLAVYARYTRRGGLDINPFRSNFNADFPSNLRGARQ